MESRGESRLERLAGWEYPLIIFTADVLLQEKEKIILAWGTVARPWRWESGIFCSGK